MTCSLSGSGICRLHYSISLDLVNLKAEMTTNIKVLKYPSLVVYGDSIGHLK